MLAFNTNRFIIFDLKVINILTVRIPEGQNDLWCSSFNNIVK